MLLIPIFRHAIFAFLPAICSAEADTAATLLDSSSGMPTSSAPPSTTEANTTASPLPSSDPTTLVILNPWAPPVSTLTIITAIPASNYKLYGNICPLTSAPLPPLTPSITNPPTNSSQPFLTTTNPPPPPCTPITLTQGPTTWAYAGLHPAFGALSAGCDFASNALENDDVVSADCSFSAPEYSTMGAVVFEEWWKELAIQTVEIVSGDGGDGGGSTAAEVVSTSTVSSACTEGGEAQISSEEEGVVETLVLWQDSVALPSLSSDVLDGSSSDYLSEHSGFYAPAEPTTGTAPVATTVLSGTTEGQSQPVSATASAMEDVVVTVTEVVQPAASQDARSISWPLE